MQQNEVAVRHRAQTKRESTSLKVEGNDLRTDSCGQEDSLEEPNVALWVDPMTSDLI